jgi:hypothetical protein
MSTAQLAVADMQKQSLRRARRTVGSTGATGMSMRSKQPREGWLGSQSGLRFAAGTIRN